MAKRKATPRSWHYGGVKTSSHGDEDIVSDYERGTLWAGIVLAVSFALMGIAGGCMGW